ncbi:FecR family protein [Pseudoteredinibacter isoporae]|uniref:Transmembrane sensor n=1 Tax=Pseudoteredinibacter isoporae TaxID=570281 RepID=A0A7X0JYB4_9GAMM|nr:FecR domain-containing protein [Pseudoteredinibacter isoporae]MBB6523676.1 transmembrane sensor [Pseudoteredinibacter isoporae]NHO89180.1 DUF4880 domain-containing protein [Pseudoteredinibacter isoporae]NIB22209.1 DUF4880 domain-containing protein [Pseudoteredinibacter isoporae]
MAEKEFANAANDELGRPEREPSSADLAWPADPSVDEAAETWLIRIQSPSFSQSEEQAFFQWLEASPANQAAYLRAEALWHSLGHSSELNQRLESYPLNDGSKQTPQKTRAWKPWFAFATAATVAALALLPNWNAWQGQQMQTGKGEQLQLSLSDGSRIQLNTQSTMQIDMRDNYRLLELEQGEAYFDIAHDPERPLIVKTQGAYVRVLGTRFNVYSDQERTQVTVVEGKVDVSTDKEFSELRQRDYQSKRVLTANEQVQLSYLESNNWLEDLIGNTPASKRSDVVEVNSDDVLAWQRGEAIYNGSSLNDVIQDLNRYYAGEIRLQDERLGESTLVAALRLDDKDAALSTLASSLSLDVVELADGEILLKAQRK